MLPHLRPHFELWPPVQHDTFGTYLLALLNAKAQLLATLGAATTRPWVALPHRLQPHLLLYQGALHLEPQCGLDQAYNDISVAAAASIRAPMGPFFHPSLRISIRPL